MKKLVIDIKDNYAVIVAGGDFEPEFLKIDFAKTDFSNDSFENGAASPTLFDLGNDRLAELYNQAEQRMLIVPMRFSLVKTLSIDRAGIETYGEQFLKWEAGQQLPEELGKFTFDLKKLAESPDSKYVDYLYFAVPEEFINALSDFATLNPEEKPALYSESFGLLNAVNNASGNNGFCAAVSLEHDGASVVLVNNGMFLGGRFITSEKPELGDEIMYYIIGHAPESAKPRIMICGNLNHLDIIGNTSWVETIPVPETLIPGIKSAVGGPALFTAAAGLIMSI